jgi:hypothetical protein
MEIEMSRYEEWWNHMQVVTCPQWRTMALVNAKHVFGTIILSNFEFFYIIFRIFLFFWNTDIKIKF